MASITETPMAILQISTDPLVALFVSGVIGVGHCEPFEDPELRLDEVEPGSLGGGPNRVDVQVSKQA
jgi:hypothetical protein